MSFNINGLAEELNTASGDQVAIWDNSAGALRRVPLSSLLYNNIVGNAQIATGAVGSNEIQNGTIQNSDLADMAAGKLKGREVGAGSGPPSNLTEAKVRELVWNDASAIDAIADDDRFLLSDASDGHEVKRGPASALATYLLAKTGTTWRWGNAAPSNAVGRNGERFANTTSGKVYTKTSGAWVEDTGVNLVIVSGAPGGGDGTDGDYAVNGASGVVYGPKAAGSWPGTIQGYLTDTPAVLRVSDRAGTTRSAGTAANYLSLSFVPPRAVKYDVEWYVALTPGGVSGSDYGRISVRQGASGVATGGTVLDGHYDHGSNWGTVYGEQNAAVRGQLSGRQEIPSAVTAGSAVTFTLDISSLAGGSTVTFHQAYLTARELL